MKAIFEDFTFSLIKLAWFSIKYPEFSLFLLMLMV